MRAYVLCFILIGLVNGQDDTFYFVKNPQDLSVVAGDEALLECAASVNAGLVYSWQQDGVTVENTTRRLQVGSNLLIRRSDPNTDQGHYACIATDATTAFSLTSRSALLNVHWLSNKSQVIVQVPSKDEVITDGVDIVLRCDAEGSGELRFEWFRNAERLRKTDRYQFKANKFHLKGATPRDNGVYKCAATNEAGTITSKDNFVLAIQGDRWSHILKEPQSVLVKKGSSALFDCVYEHADVIEWYFGEKGPLENSTSFSVLHNNSLLVHKADMHNEGLYGCVGIRGESPEIPVKYTAELEIAYLEDMTENNLEPVLPSGIGAVAEDGQIRVTCLPPRSLPPPSLYWKGPLSALPLPPTGPIRVDGTTLIIDAAKRRDAGTYTCVAENLSGSKEIGFRLVITTPPSLVKGPTSVTVDESETAVFYCQFQGMEPPITTVHWLKDNASFRQDSRLSIDQNTGTLTITNTQVSDKGDYSCLINTTGYKPLVSEWLKIGDVDDSLELPVHVQDINGTLHFNGVKWEDKGRYMCLATNPQGTINVTIDIDVVETPKFVVLPRNPTEAFEGYSIQMDCVAEGDPKPTIQWDKNSVMNDFDTKRFHVLENGSLVIDEVHFSDEGKYGCTAGNSGGLKRYEISLHVRSSEGYKRDGTLEGAETDGSMMTKTVTITLSAAAAYMLLVIGLMAWCRYRRHKRKQAYLEANPTSPSQPEATALSLLGKGDGNGITNQNGTLNGTEQKQKNGEVLRSDGENTVNSQGSNQSRRSKNGYDKLSFPRQDLHNMMLLGSGEFGEVYLAQARGIKEGTDTVVMVKALQQMRDENALQEFKRQLDMFSRLDHNNISKLIGLCRDAEPHYMILQYTDWGDLKQFLLATRKESKSNKPRPAPLTGTQILGLVHQLAQAMEHLANHRTVHRDLAARNCLISSHLELKVSFSALCRDTYAKEYFKHRNQTIPVRWMPLEAVAEDDYSCKSDIYSFAATVWEMYTRGELPFSRLSDREVLESLQRGDLHWKHHKNMPEQLKVILDRCWSPNPRDRPTFSCVAVEIGDIKVSTPTEP
ncbi:LOW QUALITY PROTEIN: inactive tyrosine-protein kinase 7 [Nilaparvata lugens]|uniref:LOW QUALITY PROTEIN: inactive tyrosine-protein kinase 7 n=1 Tax=Nilaparvata lugens TaxID=108931 RepID=UPI00193E4CD9|nr:LOW QUALITY PROTEIN: inactive tyrosine-protein kinase 7 [Nilaparvata lugens]